MTGLLKGAPHVPAGDSAVGAPAFAKGEEFLGLGHVLFSIGDGPTLFYAEVVDGENVGAAEAEDQEHFDGPGTDAADGDEALDEFVVREFFGLLEGGDDAIEGLLGEIFHGQDFCARKAGFAKSGFAKLQHFLRSGGAASGTESFNAPVNGGGGFAGDGLVCDGFKEGFVRGLKWILVHLESGSFGD